jgi:hypothetical protein
MTFTHINTDPHEEDVPAKNETFEAQILVITKPRTITVQPFNLTVMSTHWPMTEASRVIGSGNYRLELVGSELANGRPVLIIHEE